MGGRASDAGRSGHRHISARMAAGRRVRPDVLARGARSRSHMGIDLAVAGASASHPGLGFRRRGTLVASRQQLDPHLRLDAALATGAGVGGQGHAPVGLTCRYCYT